MEGNAAVLKFSDFITRYGEHSYYLEDGFAFREIFPSHRHEGHESFAGIHSILFVCEGTMDILLDGKEYTLPRNGFSDIIDLVSLEITGMSDDLRAFHLIFSEAFLGDLIKNQPPFPFSYMLDMSECPVWIVSESDRKTFVNRFLLMADVLQNLRHHFRGDLLRCAFRMFLLNVADAYMHREELNAEKQGSDHVRALFLRFMHLLKIHVCEEHTVGFYASQLCITPQYLNRIVSRVSGKSVSDTINRALTGEIIKLLDDNSLSIQEIADKLHFSDQATMCKFFKRQKGLSPTAYRLKGDNIFI